MSKIAFELPINSTSLGQISTSLLKNVYEREKNGTFEHDLSLFLIGGVDLSAQKEDRDFLNWINSKVQKAYESYCRETPIFKIWHLNGSLQSYSKNQSLLSFHETDGPTKMEVNIAKNNNLCLSSKFSQQVFDIYGVKSQYLPLFFDSVNFKQEDKKFHLDNRIVFNLCGKLEFRKNHARVIKSWIKRFGNQNDYVLQCCVTNPFLIQQTPNGVVDYNNKMIGDILQGNKPFNVVFFPYFKENSLLNQYFNSCHIALDLSGGESWSLPSFTMTAMAKHSVILNASGMKEWANESNSVLVNPSGKMDVYDGIFFHPNQPFNQGKIFDFNEDEFVFACEKAIEKVKKDKINHEGAKLKDIFTVDRFTDSVLKMTLT